MQITICHNLPPPALAPEKMKHKTPLCQSGEYTDFLRGDSITEQHSTAWVRLKKNVSKEESDQNRIKFLAAKNSETSGKSVHFP